MSFLVLNIIVYFSHLLVTIAWCAHLHFLAPNAHSYLESSVVGVKVGGTEMNLINLSRISHALRGRGTQIKVELRRRLVPPLFISAVDIGPPQITRAFRAFERRIIIAANLHTGNLYGYQNIHHRIVFNPQTFNF